jgi:hypothetical protein
VDIPFLSSYEVPVPPEEMRFRSLRAEPYSDGRRVRISLEVTPFQVRPNLDILLIDQAGEVAASAHIIEASEPKMTLTLHFRRPAGEGFYTARGTLGYPDREATDVTQATFQLTPAQGNPVE